MIAYFQVLNNLLLEAKNNEINYQANKILQITGEEPVRPPDTSSIEDKFKNVLEKQAPYIIQQIITYLINKLINQSLSYY